MRDRPGDVGVAFWSVEDGVGVDDVQEEVGVDDDGERKAADAKAAQSRLRGLLDKSSLVDRAERARQQKRTEARRAVQAQVAQKKHVADLAARFQELAGMSDEQARGLAFEPFLRDMFALFDLDPRGSYSLPGEQTDGSIRLDGTLYLVEARWRAAQADPAALRAFRGKVEDKLDNTLGFFISMSGFTDQAIAKVSEGRRVVVLIDGLDLARVLQGLVDLVDMLRRKVLPPR